MTPGLPGISSGARLNRRILILFAHPAIGRSEVNRTMFRAAAGLKNVTAVDLYAEYPTYEIDVNREQQRLVDHDVIIFQFPLYWYSTPSLLKEWQDLVLEYGFAYGDGGSSLAGKVFFNALTAGGGEEGYQKAGSNLFTMRELMQPLEQTANLCGLIYLPPFVLYRSRSARAEGRVQKHVERWVDLLLALREGRLDVQRSRALPLLNQWSDRKQGGS